MKIAAALALTSCAAMGIACANKADPPKAEPPEVHVAAVEQGTISEWLQLSGRVVPPADRDATLAPRVEGVLAEVAVKLGERVTKGKVIARVDTGLLADQLAAAEAAERSAAAEAEAKRSVATRTERLLTHGVVSGELAQTDEAAAVAAEAAHEEAKTAHATASRRRSWAVLTAPFDGVIVSLTRHAGDSVDGTPATPVVELAAEHPLEVALDATASVLARLKEGQDAEILLAASEGKGIVARVSAVAASIDPKTGTGPVRIDPAEEAAALMLGRIVEARIAVATHEAAVIVPARALRGGAEDKVEVVVVSNHKAHVREVTTGLRDGGRVEITSGLSRGDTIVVDDPVGLADDAPVSDVP